MTKKKRLPRTVQVPKLSSLPSAALMQAVGDLIKVEKDAKLLIDMTTWVSPFEGRSCYAEKRKKQHKPKANCAVCFAGAVMMNVRQPRKEFTTASFDQPLQNRLDALDEFRQGNVRGALHGWGYADDFIEEHAPNEGNDWSVPDYDDHPAKFKAEIRKMAKALAAAGF